GVFLVALVDEEARRGVRASAEADRVLESRLHPAGGVGDEDRAVGRLETGDDLRDEVEVARGVDDGDPRAIRLERRDGQAQGLAALLLLGLEVEVGAAVIDLADAPHRAGLEQELLAERRLARTRVAGEDDAPKAGEPDALGGHGRWVPRAAVTSKRAAGAAVSGHRRRGPAILVPYTPA